MECTELDIQIHELNGFSISLNQAYNEYFEILDQIKIYQAHRIRPFGLENGDIDAGLEGLIAKSHNALSKIKNWVIKLIQGIKNFLDKIWHMFDRNLVRMKQFADIINNGQLNKANVEKFLETNLKLYRKKDFLTHVNVIKREIEMNWTEVDGKIDMSKRGSLSEIGHNIRIGKDSAVTYTYNGIYPKLDTVIRHGYDETDLGPLLKFMIGIYNRFPSYKESLIKMTDNAIKSRYNNASGVDAAKHAAIIADRTQYIYVQKTIMVVVREMRELSSELLDLCNAIQ